MDDKKTWIGALLSHRQVIPRWHSPQGALHSGERDSARSNVTHRALSNRWVALLEEQSQRETTEPHVLVELEELRFILGHSRHHEGNSTSLPSALGQVRQLWHKASHHASTKSPERPQLSGDWVSHERENIGSLRDSLKSYPLQPFIWSELARSYIVLGEDEKAKRAMSCAVQLANRSAYVRRSAARMHLHLKDTQSALRIVREHPGFKADPRMISAEIAISARANAPLRFAKHGLAMLEDANFRAAHLSELAAALATVEMENGKHKRSRALFAKSLNDPSENTLAQLQWATERDKGILLPTDAWSIPRSYEARALAARLNCDWDSVLDATEMWLQDEPFTTRPAALGSFASFSEAQNKRAEVLATQALVSNPLAIGLLNNRAVARAYQGNVIGALDDVNASVGCDAENHPYLVATIGLIGYRSGDHTLGSAGYRAALARLVAQSNAPAAMLASLFWIRELVRIGDTSAQADLNYVKSNLLRFTGGKPDPEITSMIAFLDSSIGQSNLSIPGRDEVIDNQARALFDRFEVGQPVDDLRRRFLEHL